MGAEVYHRLIMLKTMQAGMSGYARLQSEAGRQLVQINLRGLGADGGLRAFWYAGDGLVRELGSGAANPRGEAGLYTQLPADSMTPGRLTALLVTDTGSRPRPLAIGLCTAQSAGSLTDAKNVLLALCEKLCREASDTNSGGKAAVAARAEGKREASEPAQPQGSGAAVGPDRAKQAAAAPDACDDGSKPAGGEQEKESPAAAPAVGQTGKRRAGAQKSPRPPKPPREVFLPAIDIRQERRRSRRAVAKERGGQAEAAGAVHGCCEADDGGYAGACRCEERRGACAAGVVCTVGTGDTVGATGAACAAGCAAGGGPAGAACAAAGGDAAAQLPAEPPKPRHSPAALPADRLPRLHWPAPFQTLAECFERCPPVKLMDWNGWRFVKVETGGHPLWIGRLYREDHIAGIAYVLPADVPAPGGMPFRRAKNTAGESVQALVLKGEQG